MNATLSPPHARRLAERNGDGRAVNFECGCFIAFELSVNDDKVEAVGFHSNGCGYMIASAEMLAKAVEGRELQALGGLIHAEDLHPNDIFGTRIKCLEAIHEAAMRAFADLRRSRAAEYGGDEALICTCFGVGETAIEAAIKRENAYTVPEVTAATRAGSGCGACRMLIQELIDANAGTP